MGLPPDKTDYYNFDGKKITNLRILPPWSPFVPAPSPVVFRVMGVPKEYLGLDKEKLIPVGVQVLNNGHVQLPCRSFTWSKFGFGCPFCEAFLNSYPEDRGEGGIE
jgi:hypothetical protein